MAPETRHFQQITEDLYDTAHPAIDEIKKQLESLRGIANTPGARFSAEMHSALDAIAKELAKVRSVFPEPQTAPFVTSPAGVPGTSGVSAVEVTDGGSGYTDAVTVSFSGGGGSGARGVARVSGSTVAGVTVTESGSGYTSEPDVILSGGGGFGAKAKASLGPKVPAVPSLAPAEPTAAAPYWPARSATDPGDAKLRSGDGVYRSPSQGFYAFERNVSPSDAPSDGALERIVTK